MQKWFGFFSFKLFNGTLAADSCVDLISVDLLVSLIYTFVATLFFIK